MTLESEPHRGTSLEQAGVSYRPLTLGAFLDIAGRFRNLTHYQADAPFPRLGYVELTGELTDGKPTYDLYVKGSLLPKQKALTFTHEIVHIYLEEDVFSYKDLPPGGLNIRAMLPTDTSLESQMIQKLIHEDRIETEAKRFFRANHTMVLGVYRKMCADRNMAI